MGACSRSVIVAPSFRLFLSLRVLMEIGGACEQDHCRDRPDDDRVPGEPTEGGHDGDRDQRADDHECVPDGEGEDAAENRAVLAAHVSWLVGRVAYGSSYNHHMTLVANTFLRRWEFSRSDLKSTAQKY